MKITNWYKIFLLGVWLNGLNACTTETVNQDPMVNLKKIMPNAEISLADLNVAISRNSSNPNLYAKRAMLFLDEKKTRKALEDIDHALSLNSDKGDFYFRRALILRETDSTSAALRAAEDAEELGLKDPEIYILQAELLLRLKRFPESLEKINLALNVVPTDEYALYYRGIGRAETNDTASAIVNFRRAIKNAPAFIYPYLQLISIYNAKKDYSMAQRYIRNASRLDSLNGYLWLQKGIWFNGLRQTDSACLSLNKAIQLNAKLYKAHYHLGVLSFKRKDYQTVVKHLEKAKTQNSNLPKITEMLAEAYEKTGRYQQAIKEYNKILQVAPNDVWAMWGVRRSNWGLIKTKRDSINRLRWQAIYPDTTITY